MCGIAGIAMTDPSRRVDVERVQRMNDALVHRGPDDGGVWHSANVALAMRRLSIIDLSGGHQPMVSEDASLALVFNGEIYNFKELRLRLEQQGRRFLTRSDTEVILQGYAAYGDRILDHLNGMFAFALYDMRRERLLLARDRLGIKPLFYCFQDGALAFASELDALRQSGLVGDDLNVGALHAYFTFLYIPAPDTIYKDAVTLRPAEKLVLEKGRLHVEPYWRLNYEAKTSWTLDSAAEAYRGLLNDAVKLQTVSDVPLGAFLSGGIDSSTVVAALSEAGVSPVKTFTIGFDDAHADELRFARIAAQHFSTEHTEDILRPDLTEIAPMLARHFGEPFADSSAAPTWLVSKAARRQVTVALSGDGGDELFAGYEWAHRTRDVSAYRHIPATLRSLIGVALQMMPDSPRIAKLRRFNADSFLDTRAVFRRRLTCFDTAARAALYGAELSTRVMDCAADRFQEHVDSAQSLSDDDWMLRQDTVMYLPDDILTKVDRMSMANSLEARVPILDHRIVEFAATVPFHLKLKGGISKRLVKHAFRKVLPPELVTQRKQGFAIPIHRWFRNDLREHFHSVVLSDDAHCHGMLNVDTIRTLFDAHVTGREDYGHHLWTLLVFEHWLRYARIGA